MKLKTTLSLLSLAVCAVTSTTVLAQTGTININGEIVSDSCTANISSSGGSGGAKDYTVQLDPVSYSALSDDGDIAGEKPFTIELTGCTVSTGKTQMWAHFTGPQVAADGLLNTANPKIAFELTDGFGKGPIKAGGSVAPGGPASDQGTASTFTGDNPDKTASKEYAVRYHARSGLTAADADVISSQVTYNIQYF